MSINSLHGFLCSVEIINVDVNRSSGGSDNGKAKDYIHPSNMEVSRNKHPIILAMIVAIPIQQ